MRWPRRTNPGRPIPAEVVRAEIMAQLAEQYGVTAETVTEARKLWAQHDDEHDGQYTFSEYLSWLALQFIELLGPSLSADELREKYRRYIDGETDT